MSGFSRPLKLAYFSPLPPARSGIAEYSRDLLPHLLPWAVVHLFVEEEEVSPAVPPGDRALGGVQRGSGGQAPALRRGGLKPALRTGSGGQAPALRAQPPVFVEPEIAWRFPVWGHSSFSWREWVHHYDCAVYHLGNSPVHRYLYPHIFSRPGVLVLHELVIHHLLAGMALEASGAAMYLREMAYAHGTEGARTGWGVLTGQREAPFFEYPLCQRAVDASLGVIVHSRYLSDQVRALSPEALVQVIPMPVPLARLPDGDGAETRRRLGLPEDGFIIGAMGEATHHKRLGVVMGGFARLLARRPDALLVLAGRVAPGLDLAGMAARLGVSGQVRVTGALPADEFAGYLRCVDVCVNLRYPTAGETSAAALRSMAAGRATVVSDVGASREIPDSCCFRIPVDADEELVLAAVLERLGADSGLRTALGAHGRAYVAREHAPEASARAYVALLEEVLGGRARHREAEMLRGNASEHGTRERAEARTTNLPALVGEVAMRAHEVGITTDDVGVLEAVANAMGIMEG